jgi:tRNA A-37 threonylcarbamoyl transferase component Bud32
MSIIHTFQNILDEGEITLDILNKVLSKMGEIKDLEIKSSSGSSFVFISNELENVFQYFINSTMENKISNIIMKLLKNKHIKINLLYDEEEIIEMNYNILEYMGNYIYNIPDPYNIIVWKKHICLNSFPKDKIVEIVNNNIFKLMWDIGKCIYGLHQNNIIHNDVSIDNIGINSTMDKFILFDFDASNVMNPMFNYSIDVYKFLKSIKHNSKDNWNNIKNFIPKYTENYTSSYVFLNEVYYLYEKNKNKNNNIKIEDIKITL